MEFEDVHSYFCVIIPQQLMFVRQLTVTFSLFLYQLSIAGAKDS